MKEEAPKSSLKKHTKFYRLFSPRLKNGTSKVNMRKQWIHFAIAMIVWIAFLLWTKSPLGIIVIPFIYDAYITKRIHWQWWKDSEKPIRFTMSWVDAIVFALVVVYFINQFFFQNYVIPSSSLEKSLLTGDYLFVSKVSYGPRKPQTPLTMPLTQHTLPVFKCKSYIEWPHWKYERVTGFGNVSLNDIVVFNYPAGDTLCSSEVYQAHDFYQMCYAFGRQLLPNLPNLDSLNANELRKVMEKIYHTGREYIRQNSEEYGKITTRPVDRRENYVKRCVGLPGQTLEIRDKIVYLDGEMNKEPDNVQYSYRVKLRSYIPESLIEELGISMEDIASMNTLGYIPLTNRAVEVLKNRSDIVESITPVTENSYADIYPLNGNLHWTRDNYGPVWIPKKGESIELTLQNIAIYERPIRTYEGNDLEIRGGKIYINNEEASTYTFKMDYYWMMGDNRHNSADSRYWGFVPEDHIVGKPIFIWLSLNPDKNGFSSIRWSRILRLVDNIK